MSADGFAHRRITLAKLRMGSADPACLVPVMLLVSNILGLDQHQWLKATVDNDRINVVLITITVSENQLCLSTRLRVSRACCDIDTASFFRERFENAMNFAFQ